MPINSIFLICYSKIIRLLYKNTIAENAAIFVIFSKSLNWSEEPGIFFSDNKK